MFGDPHITTLDGFLYDYNGIGEYWMIRSDKLSFQSRTESAWDANGVPVNASVFSAFGIQVPIAVNQNMSDRVFVEMNSQRSSKFGMTCLINYVVLKSNECEILCSF